ncbi:DUF2277 family protein [Streptomyces achromogenes]|uniref:DUF2277 family protein n=1 Tax=Streptomyces achromogenes TaxID=67255 RepID=UPI00358F7FE8
MCRSIKTLRPPALPEEATEDEVRAAALQYVRKVSGFRAPEPGAGQQGGEQSAHPAGAEDGDGAYVVRHGAVVPLVGRPRGSGGRHRDDRGTGGGRGGRL